MRTMEGVTSVNRSSAQVINVHSGNQLRLTVDVSEQMPKDMLAKEVDFTVHDELAHKDVDPFVSSKAGKSSHPWTKSSAAEAMRSTDPPQSEEQQAVPDASAVDLPKPAVAPAVPQVGGPPVGLGGPGNVAALSQKKPGAGAAAKAGAAPSQGRLPDPKRQARRAKAAPPPALNSTLDYVPDQRVFDRFRASANQFRPPSSGAGARPASATRSRSQASLAPAGTAHPLGGRSDSMPRLPAARGNARRY